MTVKFLEYDLLFNESAMKINNQPAIASTIRDQ